MRTNFDKHRCNEYEGVKLTHLSDEFYDGGFVWHYRCGFKFSHASMTINHIKSIKQIFPHWSNNAEQLPNTAYLSTTSSPAYLHLRRVAICSKEVVHAVLLNIDSPVERYVCLDIELEETKNSVIKKDNTAV